MLRRTEEPLFRTTQDLLELRRWAEARAARPHRQESTGRLALAVPGGSGGREVGWEEFEPAFRALGQVCVYDGAPGACRSFIGSPEEALRFLRAAVDAMESIR